jgi:cytidylate kinase
MMNPEQRPWINAQIYVTGNEPVAGQTTISNLIEQYFDIPHYHAGALQRKLAHTWHENAGDITEFFQNVVDNPPDFYPTADDPITYDEDELKLFHQAVEDSHLGKALDELTDFYVLENILKGQSAVFEGKLTIALHLLEGVPDLDKVLAIPIIRILLLAPTNLDEQVSRLMERRIEKGEVLPPSNELEMFKLSENTAEKLNRAKTDRERFYNSYGITAIEIENESDIVVDTTGKSIDQVFSIVLLGIAQLMLEKNIRGHLNPTNTEFPMITTPTS